MTLPASGAISFNNINVELGVSGTTQASLNQASYRNLAGVASGAISMSNFYGKSSAFSLTISSNQTNANLRTLAIAAGWNGSSTLNVTINSVVFVYSTSTATPARTVNGSFPGGVTLVNGGTIQGQGGAGARGGICSLTSGYSTTQPTLSAAPAGSAGGLALAVSSAITITNNGRIAGGGGGGGGGTARYNNDGKGNFTGASGGGGGGALGGNGGAAGAGGGGTAGNGVAGTQTTAGAGGARGVNPANGWFGGAGGAGGSYAANGTSGVTVASGTAYTNGSSGGAGGGAITGNSNITWLATGTRNGSITS